MDAKLLIDKYLAEGYNPRPLGRNEFQRLQNKMHAAHDAWKKAEDEFQQIRRSLKPFEMTMKLFTARETATALWNRFQKIKQEFDAVATPDVDGWEGP
jgi:hypothetical protein